MTPTGYTIYETEDHSIEFPRQGAGIFLLVEGMKTGLPFLGSINLGMTRTLFVPSSLSVAGKNIKFDGKQIQSALMSKNFKVTQSIEELKNSFIFDSTPYVATLFNDLNPNNYVKATNQFFKNIIGIINEEAPAKFNTHSLVYILDDTIVSNRNIVLSDLYLWFFMKALITLNGKYGGSLPFSDIYLCYRKKGQYFINKIYDNKNKIDMTKIREVMLKNNPELVDEEDDNDEENKNLSIEKALKNLTPEVVQKFLKWDQEDKKKNKSSTTEEKPIDDKLDNASKELEVEQVKKDVAPTSMNNFPFLLSKASPQKQAQEITDKEISVMAKIVAVKSGTNKSREWIIDKYNSVKSLLSGNNKQASEAMGLFKQRDFDKLSVYVNTAVEEYKSNLYPVKPPTDQKHLDDLDKWSQDRGYEKPQQMDPVFTSEILDNHIHSNFHRAMAQKEITWSQMPEQIEAMITPVLEDAGFQFISIQMVDREPDVRQVEPTYMTEIKIRIKNTKTKKVQTVMFMVPTLLEGKYHISGGIKWLFPNILATLPIFVIDPGKVQFKTNYSASTFEHHTSNKKDTVTVLVGGVKMPLLVWLLQLRSFDDICEDFGIEYEIVNSKKELIESTDMIVKLPDRQLMAIKVTATDHSEVKLAKAIYYDLQPLINKIGMIDLHNADEEAGIIVKLTGRKTASYAFRKIKRYMIDIRIANILQQRSIKPDLYNVSKLCAKFSINNVEEDKLGISNVYLRLMDLIPSEIERAFHYSLTEYRRRSAIDPDAPLMVNSGWVINALRENAVLILYRDGNPTVEAAQFTAVRLVGPGGFSKVDTVQVKDRRIPSSHFGVIDPIDTAEGNPGVQTYLTTGFEYDPDNKTFKQVEQNNNVTNMFSAAASQIPFISSNDGNRAQFGCSQTRQVVPVINSEVPLVGTGMESYIPSYGSSKFIKKSKKPGVVAYIDKKVIIIKYDDGTVDNIDIRSDSLQTGSGKANAVVHTPIVKIGDRVRPFQQLVKNPFIQGAYSSGINVLAAFKTEEGYSYEDGVVVSETFAKKYTSSHYNTIDISVDALSELKVFPIQKLKETGEMKYHAGETIVKISTSFLGGFQENSVVAPAECEVVDIDIYPAKPEFIPLVKEVDNLLNSRTNAALRQNGLKPISNINGIIDNVGKFKFRKDELKRTLVRIKLVEYRTAGLGDKLNNRHGNKGVITRICPDDEMPRLPDGRKLEVCFNPLGVVGRMNLGQVYEIHCGNILDSLKRRIIELDDIKARDMVCSVYTLLDGYPDKKLSKDIVKNLMAMGSAQLKQTMDYLREHGVRMIFPPYKTPPLTDIEKAADVVGTHLKDKLFLPKYGRSTINECAWGVLFVNKLEHISAIKQNTRSTGAYIKHTLMPAKPGNHRNAIRISELDTWAISAYDANTVLTEFFTVNGDNPKVKNQVIYDIENSGTASVKDVEASGSSKAFETYMIVAGLKV